MAYLNLVGSFVYKEPLFVAKLDALAENDAQLKLDGWAQNTKILFFQPSVPTGWTQDTSQNDKALRVVGPTGGGVSGGTQALSSTIHLAHTHAISSDDAHTHAYTDHTHPMTFAGGATISSETFIYVNSANVLIGYSNPGGGGTGITPVSSTLASPGAITLGTLAAHNHGGTTPSALTDIVFAYCDVIVGTKNAPGGTYTDLTSYWTTGQVIDFDPFAEYANNDAYNFGNLMPAGSITIFGQAASPVGWTKIAAVNDRMLRVVSGVGGGVGGTQPISSGVSLAHTHVLTATSDHTHSIPSHTHVFANTAGTTGTTMTAAASFVLPDGSGGMVQASSGGSPASRTCINAATTNTGSGNTSAAGGHTHVLPNSLTDLTLAYVDVIEASKDSTGAPYAYTDMTSSFAWKNLVSYQRLNSLATNDAYVQYHTTPVGSMAFFFMASPPTGWAKITTANDIALRVVSGGTGGTIGGGSQNLSATITLGHLHTIGLAGGHTHTATHTHPLDTSTQTAFPASSNSIGVIGGALAAGPGPGTRAQLATTSNNPNETPTADPDHQHGGATDSQLSDVQLAYADVIWCTKS
jgi:hypothetical protein